MGKKRVRSKTAEGLSLLCADVSLCSCLRILLRFVWLLFSALVAWSHTHAKDEEAWRKCKTGGWKKKVFKFTQRVSSPWWPCLSRAHIFSLCEISTRAWPTSSSFFVVIPQLTLLLHPHRRCHCYARERLFWWDFWLMFSVDCVAFIQHPMLEHIHISSKLRWITKGKASSVMMSTTRRWWRRSRGSDEGEKGKLSKSRIRYIKS